MSLENSDIPQQAPEAYLQIYKLWRERVSQEDQLVNHRMGWMLWSNAILFGFFVGLTSALNGKGTLHQGFYLLAAAIMIAAGVVCTFGSIFAINAALGEIKYLKDVYYKRYPQILEAERNKLMPSIVGHKNAHVIGQIVPWLIPVTIIVLWFALLFLVFYSSDNIASCV